MASVPRAAAYHRLAFELPDEAAAFVAALSRYLASPAGSAFRASETPVEIWATTMARQLPLTLYLSRGALRATVAGFGMPATITPVDDLPPQFVLLFGKDDRGAYGAEEIMRRIVRSAWGFN